MADTTTTASCVSTSSSPLKMASTITTTTTAADNAAVASAQTQSNSTNSDVSKPITTSSSTPSYTSSRSMGHLDGNPLILHTKRVPVKMNRYEPEDPTPVSRKRKTTDFTNESTSKAQKSARQQSNSYKKKATSTISTTVSSSSSNSSTSSSSSSSSSSPSCISNHLPNHNSSSNSSKSSNDNNKSHRMTTRPSNRFVRPGVSVLTSSSTSMSCNSNSTNSNYGSSSHLNNGGSSRESNYRTVQSNSSGSSSNRDPVYRMRESIKRHLHSIHGQKMLITTGITHQPFARLLISTLSTHVDKVQDLVRMRRNKQQRGKMTRTMQVQEMRVNRRVDLNTPESILTNINLSSIINKKNFDLLPKYYQYRLTQLLPKRDQQLLVDSVIAPSATALNNEFIARAFSSYHYRLQEGRMTGDAVSRLKREFEREKKNLDPLKVKYFEPYFRDPIEPTTEERCEAAFEYAKSIVRTYDYCRDQAANARFVPRLPQPVRTQAEPPLCSSQLSSSSNKTKSNKPKIMDELICTPAVHNSIETEQLWEPESGQFDQFMRQISQMSELAQQQMIYAVHPSSQLSQSVQLIPLENQPKSKQFTKSNRRNRNKNNQTSQASMTSPVTYTTAPLIKTTPPRQRGNKSGKNVQQNSPQALNSVPTQLQLLDQVMLLTQEPRQLPVNCPTAATTLLPTTSEEMSMRIACKVVGNALPEPFLKSLPSSIHYNGFSLQRQMDLYLQTIHYMRLSIAQLLSLLTPDKADWWSSRAASDICFTKLKISVYLILRPLSVQCSTAINFVKGSLVSSIPRSAKAYAFQAADGSSIQAQWEQYPPEVAAELAWIQTLSADQTRKLAAQLDFRFDSVLTGSAATHNSLTTNGEMSNAEKSKQSSNTIISDSTKVKISSSTEQRTQKHNSTLLQSNSNEFMNQLRRIVCDISGVVQFGHSLLGQYQALFNSNNQRVLMIRPADHVGVLCKTNRFAHLCKLVAQLFAVDIESPAIHHNQYFPPQLQPQSQQLHLQPQTVKIGNKTCKSDGDYCGGDTEGTGSKRTAKSVTTTKVNRNKTKTKVAVIDKTSPSPSLMMSAPSTLNMSLSSSSSNMLMHHQSQYNLHSYNSTSMRTMMAASNSSDSLPPTLPPLVQPHQVK